MLSEPEESKMLTEKKNEGTKKEKAITYYSLEELILLKCPYNPE